MSLGSKCLYLLRHFCDLCFIVDSVNVPFCIHSVTKFSFLSLEWFLSLRKHLVASLETSSSLPWAVVTDSQQSSALSIR